MPEHVGIASAAGAIASAMRVEEMQRAAAGLFAPQIAEIAASVGVWMQRYTGFADAVVAEPQRHIVRSTLCRN